MNFFNIDSFIILSGLFIVADKITPIIVKPINKYIQKRKFINYAANHCITFEKYRSYLWTNEPELYSKLNSCTKEFSKFKSVYVSFDKKSKNFGNIYENILIIQADVLTWALNKNLPLNF